MQCRTTTDRRAACCRAERAPVEDSQGPGAYGRQPSVGVGISKLPDTGIGFSQAITSGRRGNDFIDNPCPWVSAAQGQHEATQIDAAEARVYTACSACVPALRRTENHVAIDIQWMSGRRHVDADSGHTT